MKSSYPALWLLLTGALIIFLVISFSDDISLGNYRVKKAPFSETLFPDTAGDESGFLSEIVTIVGDSAKLAQAFNENHPDTLPKNILLFGDSMTLNLAYQLARYARQNGHELHSINWDSSNTKTWSDTDTLSYYMNLYKPDFVFISLGSNEVYFKNPYKRQPNVRKILSVIGDIPYIWIGPPCWDDRTSINDMLQATCRPGTFFWSAGMEFERKKDKIHPTRSASALWIDSIMRWMPKSAHPILSVPPADSIGQITKNIVYLKPLNR